MTTSSTTMLVPSVSKPSPEVIKGDTWTAEQQVQELTRRAMPSVNAMRKPVSFVPRPTDIIVATAPKSGTAWVTHICHQLRTGGAEPDFEEQVPDVVTILEFSLPFFHTDPDTVVQRAEPRIYYSHLPYATIPKGAKYIYCFRDQKDALYSWYLFADTMYMLKGRVSLDVFIDFYQKLHWTANNLHNLLAWWERRHDDNVLLLFFDDLKEDHVGCVKRIARLMASCRNDEETIARVVHTTTHAEMSKHHSKFDLHSLVQHRARLVGDDPPTVLVGRVRMDGGKSGDGRTKLPRDVLQLIDDEWHEIITSRLGFKDLKEMRDAWKRENETG